MILSGCFLGFIYKIKYSFQEVLPNLRSTWEKASSLFVPPVVISDPRICLQIFKSYKLMQDIVYRRVTKKAVVNAFKRKLDMLYDITRCKCKILTCAEKDCAGCTDTAHIHCICPEELKLPTKELFFIRHVKYIHV